jgi:hypothetical protein
VRSALADLAAALVPAEYGGPEPPRAAAATRPLIDAMPPAVRGAVAAGLLGLEAAAVARHGRPLGRLRPEQRVALLEGLARVSPALDVGMQGLKALVLLGWGAASYAQETRAVARRGPPARADAELTLIDAEQWPPRSRCDALVIGSGAGGAFAARALARAGREVVILEEGERWTVARVRDTDPVRRFAGLYRDGGATFALGSPSLALPIGRAVGGTTVVNSGTCYRPPEAVVRRWHERCGLELAEPEGLAARLDDVEETIGVAPAPLAGIGRNAELALAGAAALGWRAAPLRRNAPGCAASCQCAIGCPRNAKAGVHLNALPQACRAGARIVGGARVERVLVEDGRAVGALARARDGRRIELRAPLVVVAAGATETPPLLRRSGIGRHPALGRNLSVHPAVGITGVFEEPVHAWRGVLQSVGVEQLHERAGVLIEATATPPGMGAVGYDGYGRALLERLARADHAASLGAMIADGPGGRVVGARRPLVLYRLSRRDRNRLLIAVEAMARLLLAAGARRVELGGGAPPVGAPHELPAALAQLSVERLRLAAFHPTGTAAAGADPARHPVDGRGRLRGVHGVLVADASILPSCPTVNPQLSIMALAIGVGERAG